MKRYFLATAVLAIGAGGVVWIAIKERAAERAAKGPATAIAEPRASAESAIEIKVPASAAPSANASASATPTPDVPLGDASVPDSGQTFPPLAAYAAWSVVRWGMSGAEVERALKEAGVVIVEAAENGKHVRAKSGPWDVTIAFDGKSASEIVVTATNRSKEEAQAVVAKVKERAPATQTIARSERRWKKEMGAVATLETNVDGANATMREEHVRDREPAGWIGFAGLRWGMSTQEVVGLLTARGYGARVVKALPTALDANAKKTVVETVPFSKGDVEGTASFNQFGLRHLEMSGPTTVDVAASRAKELEASLGKPASVEASTKTTHIDHGRMTSIEVDVTEKQPGGLTISETYRPKK